MERKLTGIFKGRWHINFLLLLFACAHLRADSSERYPETRKRFLGIDEIRGWTDAKLRYAINEMYARRGAEFRDTKINSWFEKFNWYHPRKGMSYDAIETEFSDIEKANVKLLGEARQKLRNGSLPESNKSTDARSAEIEHSAEELSGDKNQRGAESPISAYIVFGYMKKDGAEKDAPDGHCRENLPDAAVTEVPHGEKYLIAGSSKMLPYSFKIELTSLGSKNLYRVRIVVVDIDSRKALEGFPREETTELAKQTESHELTYDLPFSPAIGRRLQAFAINQMKRDGESERRGIEIDSLGLRIVRGRVPHFD